MSIIYNTTGEVDNNNVLKGVNLYDTKESIKIYDINSKMNKLDSYIMAGNIHKHVRKIVQPMIEPGMKLSTIANLIESTTRQLTNNVGINFGIGFPTGLSLNECAAHYSPFKDGENIYDLIFSKDDILKIDFGVEVNGYIIDSAFTVYFDHKYDILAKAVKDATNIGIKNIGIDVVINDWAQDIFETMTSYEVDGKPINPITSLGGHNILRRIIHGGMFLPSKPTSYYNESNRFKPGVYAVETFGSMGTGDIDTIYEENSLYSFKKVNSKVKSKSMNNIIKKLFKSFNTLPFSSRFLDFPKLRNIEKRHLDKLVDNGILNSYPPLVDNSGYSAQYEHTIFLDEGKKINLSKDYDY